ncbi:MAG: tetratricopeptide repeat protein [Pirellulales bacterium]
MKHIATTIAAFASTLCRSASVAGLALVVVATSSAGCASVTKRAGTDEDVHVLRAEQREKAVAEFESKRDAAQLQAALERLRCGATDDARAMLEAIVARNADFLPARLLLAEILLESNQPALALEQARLVVERAPREASARHIEGLILEALGRPDEALASFQQAADLEPDNEVYQLSYRTAADQIVRNDAFVEMPSPGDVDATLAAAASALQRNAPEESIRLLSAALEYAPSDARLWRALGASHYRRGDYGQAQVVLAKAVSLDTTDPLSYFLLGATLRQQGQTSEAERHLAVAAEIDPRYATWR